MFSLLGSVKSPIDDVYCGNAGLLFAINTLRDSGYIIPNANARGDALAADIMSSASARGKMPVWGLRDGTYDLTYPLGYAHGSIGILHALAGRRDVESGNSREQWINFGLKAILRDVMDAGGLRFFADSERTAPNNNLCNGLVGILWSFGTINEYQGILEEVARICLSASAFNEPIYCHGLAAQLDVARIFTRDRRIGNLANDYRRRVRAHLMASLNSVDGCYSWRSDQFGRSYPDFWFGFLGTLTAVSIDAESDFDSPFDARLVKMMSG
jgi:hypothetical protein